MDVCNSSDRKINRNIELIRGSLQPLPETTIHIRGSFLEKEYPSIHSDIDLYVIFYSKRINIDYINRIKSSLSFTGRLIDIHGYTLSRLKRTAVENYLFHMRSLYLVGEQMPAEQITIDIALINSFWKAYNPSFPPDLMFSNRVSRVCALKNLTRCFGLISFIEHGNFTRDIDECLSYAKRYDENIYQLLIHNWSMVDFRQPLPLKEIKNYLVSYYKRWASNLK